jgi:hypothetical protein
MAGLGAKTFTPSEVLTAADVNGYFMDQVICNFADIAAADTFFTANPSRKFVGRVIFAEDEEALYIWDGSAWTAQTAIIADGSITTAKLNQTASSEAVTTATIRNLNVTTAKIADQAVTSAKLGPVEITSITTNTTLALVHYGKMLRVNSSSAVTLTVPDNGTVAFATGTEIYVVRYGTGTVTFAEGSGVTILSDTSRKNIKTQYSSASVVKLDTNEWLLTGNLAD